MKYVFVLIFILSGFYCRADCDAPALSLEDVPAEALVISGPDGQIPEHVKRNPKGFGIIDSNGAEQEVTFIGVIPPEWIANMREIKRDYERVLSIP